MDLFNDNETDIWREKPRRRRRSLRRADRLDQLQDLLLRIDAALVVRDPGNARSAEAYEGLRRQVVAAASDRRKHVVQLSELAGLLHRGTTVEAINSLTEEWLLQANILTITDPTDRAAFEFVGEGGQGQLAVLVTPAFLDLTTNTLIRRGIAEFRRLVVDDETGSLEAEPKRSYSAHAGKSDMNTEVPEQVLDEQEDE